MGLVLGCGKQYVSINFVKCIQQSAGISFFPHILPLFPLKEDELSIVGTIIDTLPTRHKHQQLFYQRTVSKDSWDDYMGLVLNTAVTRKVLNSISACHPDWNNALPILSSKESSNPWSSSFYQFHLFPAANLQTSPNVPFRHIFWRATLKMPLRLFTKEPNGKILEDVFQYFQSCIFPSGIETLEMAERGEVPQGEDLIERNYLPITIFLLLKLPNNIKTYDTNSIRANFEFCLKLQKDSFIDENIYIKQFVICSCFLLGKTILDNHCIVSNFYNNHNNDNFHNIFCFLKTATAWQQSYTRKYLLFHIWPQRPSCQVKNKCSSSSRRIL